MSDPKRIFCCLVAAFLLFGCASVVDSPKLGDKFDSNIWADRPDPNNPRARVDPNNFYKFRGVFGGAELYTKNPRWIASKSDFSGGILVVNGKIIRVLSQPDLDKFLAAFNSRAQRNAQNDALIKEFQRYLAGKGITYDWSLSLNQDYKNFAKLITGRWIYGDSQGCVSELQKAAGTFYVRSKDGILFSVRRGNTFNFEMIAEYFLIKNIEKDKWLLKSVRPNEDASKVRIVTSYITVDSGYRWLKLDRQFINDGTGDREMEKDNPSMVGYRCDPNNRSVDSDHQGQNVGTSTSSPTTVKAPDRPVSDSEIEKFLNNMHGH